MAVTSVIVRSAQRSMLPSSFAVEAVYPTIQDGWLYPDELVGVGIDIESTPLPSGVGERSWFALHNGCDGARLFGKLFFSVKVAVYKCQCAMTRSFVGFKEVELADDVCRGTFSAVDPRGNGRPWRNMVLGPEGRFRLEPRLIMTAAILRKSRRLC
jgi:4'-phosphopantetheinyl transferase EntD